MQIAIFKKMCLSLVFLIGFLIASLGQIKAMDSADNNLTPNSSNTYNTSSINSNSQEILLALSIDGGGIRGIIPIRILEAIEKNMKRPICEIFKLIAGTSTGGLLTLGLTIPDPKVKTKPRYSASDLAEIFSGEERYQVFPFSWWRTITSFGSVTRALYPATSFEKVLKDRFGDTYQTEALTDIYVTATEFRTKNMTIFCKNGKDIGATVIPGKILMRNIARATSAAPSYFTAGEVIEPELGGGYTRNYYVDGGVCCNNPAQIAWNRLQREYNATPQNVYLLSLGTGTPDKKLIKTPTPDSNVLKWVYYLTDYFMEGNSMTVEAEMESLLGPNNYKRVQPVLDTVIDLAGVDAKNIEILEKAAKSIINDGKTINNICARIRQIEQYNLSLKKANVKPSTNS